MKVLRKSDAVTSFYDGIDRRIYEGGAVSRLSVAGHVTYVPIVPKTLFWCQKKRKEILVTYLEGFTPSEGFPKNFRDRKKMLWWTPH